MFTDKELRIIGICVDRADRECVEIENGQFTREDMRMIMRKIHNALRASARMQQEQTQ